MGGALSPVVHRSTPYARRILIPYVTGSLLGGLLLGLLLAVLSAGLGLVLPAAVIQLLVGVLITGYAVGEIAGGLPRPQLRRQVPQNFLRTKYLSTTSFLFGLDLGNGMTTQQPTSALLILALASVALGPGVALAVGVGFGAVRGATLAAGWRLDSVERLPARFGPLNRRRRWAHVGTALVGALTAAILIVPAF